MWLRRLLELFDIRFPEKRMSDLKYKLIDNGRDAPRESVPSPVAMIYRSEFDYISRCILDYPNIETGGQLFGFWTSTGIPVVHYAIGPGKNANHQETFFNQDLDYLLKVGNFLLEKYGLQHIGEWHSHHQLGLAKPSGHDDSTMVNNIQRSHLRRFLLCIGNCTVERGVVLGDATLRTTLNAFNFHEDHGYDYVKACWSIKECESPFRKLVDQDLRETLVHPYAAEPCHGKVYTMASQNSGTVVESFEDGYWLNSKDNKKVLVQIHALLKEKFALRKVAVNLDEKHHVCITVSAATQENSCGSADTLPTGAISIYFPEGFPQKPVEISVDEVTAEGGLWNFQGDILDAFIHYFAAVTIKMPPTAWPGISNEK